VNGHFGSSNVGYDGTHGSYGYGSRNADGSRILEFTDRLNLVICNTLFMKQESKLMTYVAGSAKSTADYINLRQRDKAKVRNIKVIPNEVCVPKHKLLVMDMQLIQQQDGVRSSSQKCMYGSSRRRYTKAWSEIR